MIFTFYRAMGLQVGGSLVEEDLIPLAKELMEKAKKKGVQLHLPLDVVVAQQVEKKSVYLFFIMCVYLVYKFMACLQVSEESESVVVDVLNIPDNWLGLDIGPKTIQKFSDTLQGCKTVVWNGPMGVFEVPKVISPIFTLLISISS